MTAARRWLGAGLSRPRAFRVSASLGAPRGPGAFLCASRLAFGVNEPR